MNTSNPYGTESIARQRQAEIEQQLRQAALLRGQDTLRSTPNLKRRLAVGLTSLSILGLLLAIIAIQLS